MEGIRERILSLPKIITINDCWLFNGCKTTGPKGGYSYICYMGKKVLLHRLVCHLWHGLDMKDNLQKACHLPICTSRACFNPEHVYKGNNHTNRLDTAFAGTDVNARKTHCKRGHEYNKNNTHIDRTGKRHCRACNRFLISETKKNKTKGEVQRGWKS